MDKEDREAIKEVINSIMSHSPDEIGLDQSHAEVLMSILINDDSKKYRNRVIEYLRFHNDTCYRDIAATFGGDWGLTMDGILLAKDEGKIKLVDGKYRLVEGV